MHTLGMMCAVESLSLVSAVLGAAVALGGTVLAHTLRRRDELGRENRAMRRQAYVDFVLALGETHSRLRMVADPTKDPAQLARDVTEAMSEARAYERRETFLVMATPSVVASGESAFRQIVQLRDVIRGGAGLNSLAYHEAYHRLSAATWQLRQAIRADLGTPPLTLADVGKSSWDSQEHCRFCQELLAVKAATASAATQPTATPATATPQQAGTTAGEASRA